MDFLGPVGDIVVPHVFFSDPGGPDHPFDPVFGLAFYEEALSTNDLPNHFSFGRLNELFPCTCHRPTDAAIKESGLDDCLEQPQPWLSQPICAANGP